MERAGSILQENENLDVSPNSSFIFLFARPHLGRITQQTTATFDIFLQDPQRGDASDGNDGGDVRVNERSNGVEVLNQLRLRYFSPSELLRLFCFERVAHDVDGTAEKKAEDEKTFVWPEGVSAKSKYRLIGNSVNVLVVSRLIDFLFA